jgi:cytochrome c peroxidase
MKQSFGLALLVSASAVAPLALGGCGDIHLPPPIGGGTGTPLTEYSDRIAGPSLDGPTAVLRSAVHPVPETTVRDAAKVRLGRILFHDTLLSGDNTVSCASCHSLDRGGADGRATAMGIRGQLGPINSPTVLNSRFHIAQFWDGRADDLREQAAGPVANPGEMGSTWDSVVSSVRQDAQYPAMFAASYADGVTAINIRDAIATYEETLVTPSRVDRWLKGDEQALNTEERAGAELFVTQGCVTCHQGVAFGGTSFQRIGALRNYFTLRNTPMTEADNGRFNHTHNESDRHFFKVPTLRNIALTAPYFHDGSQTTLAGAVRTMASVQLGRDLTDVQVNHLVAFLTALTGELPADARPAPGEVPTRTPLTAGAGGFGIRPAGAPVAGVRPAVVRPVPVR